MRACFVVTVAVSLTLFGCSSSSGSSSGGDTAIGDPPDEAGTLADGARIDTATTGDTAGTDAATTTDTSTGIDAGPPIPFCVAVCTTAVDCAAGSAAFDVDNYACDKGTCRYVGCKSDDECRSSFASSQYVCRSVSGSTTPTCVHDCTTASDCAVASGGGAYDADNWSCESKSCKYLGCNTDAECTSSFPGAYVCRVLSVPGLDPLPTATKNCVKACSTVADCNTPSPAFDADNYVCESGACRYTGCRTDEECKSTFSKPGYACR
jgi:hypothetical protein